MRIPLLVALSLLASLAALSLSPTSAACMTPAGGGDGCGSGPVTVCLGIAIDSPCRADLACVSETVADPTTACAPGVSPTL
jgi:hypothetical protein